MLFTNIGLLAGLAALGIPIVIHLLLKRKKQRLRFSTIQFFQKQDQQSTKNRKLRNLLLLAVRLLLLALLVLAFARPYLPQNQIGPGAQKRRQVIFVVDRSASMQANGTDGLRWERAKEAIQKILSGLKPEDRAALVDCSTRNDVLSGFAPSVAISRALNELQPTFGRGDIGESLRQAIKLLAFSDPKFATTICVVTDLQRNECQKLASAPVPPDVEVKLLNVGDLFTSNNAVTDLQLNVQGLPRAQATLANYSDEETKQAKVDLAIDGKPAGGRSTDLKVGAITNVEIALPKLAPGWHSAEVRLQGKDGLTLDNVRYQSIFVPQAVRVLVVEGRKTSRSFEEETFFITSALDPTQGTTNPSPARFMVDKISPDALVNKLSARPDQPHYEVVILPGLRQIPAGAGQALSSFVRAGGGLMIFLGDGISLNRYNSEFKDLLPAQLTGIDSRMESNVPWHLGEYDTNSSIFAAFRLPNSGNLALHGFSRRCSLALIASNVVTAQFDDGTPLLTGRMLGQGRIVLVNTSADTSWTDWPKHKTFVPWLHGVGNFLAGRSVVEQFQSATNFMSGQIAEIELGTAAGKRQFKFQRPGEKEIVVTADDQGRLRDLDLAMPGIYTLRDQTGRELQRLAVNLPALESELAALSPNEFQQQLVRDQTPRPTPLAASLFGQTSNQKELWRVLLMAVVVLLFVELLLANRTLV